VELKAWLTMGDLQLPTAVVMTEGLQTGVPWLQAVRESFGDPAADRMHPYAPNPIHRFLWDRASAAYRFYTQQLTQHEARLARQHHPAVLQQPSAGVWGSGSTAELRWRNVSDCWCH
jgi:hypothetical protein